MAGGHDLDGGDQFLAGGAFEHVALGSGLQRLVNIGVPVKGGQHQHARAGVLAADFDGGLNAVLDRHTQVHQHQIRLAFAVEVHGLVAVGRFAHNHHVGFRVDQADQPHADDKMVVRHQDADVAIFFHQTGCGWASFIGTGSCGMGILTRTVAPALGALEKVISPRRRLARSEMPNKPKWPSRGPAQSSRANPFPLSLICKITFLGP